MIDPTEAGAWFVAAKAGVEALKSAWSLLPKGAEKDALAHKIEEAEQALGRADVKLAKELGYKLWIATGRRKSCFGKSSKNYLSALIQTAGEQFQEEWISLTTRFGLLKNRATHVKCSFHSSPAARAFSADSPSRPLQSYVAAASRACA